MHFLPMALRLRLFVREEILRQLVARQLNQGHLAELLGLTDPSMSKQLKGVQPVRARQLLVDLLELEHPYADGPLFDAAALRTAFLEDSILDVALGGPDQSFDQLEKERGRDERLAIAQDRVAQLCDPHRHVAHTQLLEGTRNASSGEVALKQLWQHRTLLGRKTLSEHLSHWLLQPDLSSEDRGLALWVWASAHFAWRQTAAAECMYRILLDSSTVQLRSSTRDASDLDLAEIALEQGRVAEAYGLYDTFLEEATARPQHRGLAKMYLIDTELQRRSGELLPSASTLQALLAKTQGLEADLGHRPDLEETESIVIYCLGARAVVKAALALREGRVQDLRPLIDQLNACIPELQRRHERRNSSAYNNDELEQCLRVHRARLHHFASAAGLRLPSELAPREDLDGMCERDLSVLAGVYWRRLQDALGKTRRVVAYRSGLPARSLLTLLLVWFIASATLSRSALAGTGADPLESPPTPPRNGMGTEVAFRAMMME